MVDAGGNAPLVGFRMILRRRVYSPRSGSASFGKRVASPGNAPGRQGYEPRVWTSRLAVEWVAVAGVVPAFRCSQGTCLHGFDLTAFEKGRWTPPDGFRHSGFMMDGIGNTPPRAKLVWRPARTLVRGFFPIPSMK